MFTAGCCERRGLLARLPEVAQAIAAVYRFVSCGAQAHEASGADPPGRAVGPFLCFSSRLRGRFPDRERETHPFRSTSRAPPSA